MGLHLLGDETVTDTETNKAAKQLTGSKTGSKTKSNPRPFFFHGWQHQRPRTNFQKSYQKDRRQNNKSLYPKMKKEVKTNCISSHACHRALHVLPDFLPNSETSVCRPEVSGTCFQWICTKMTPF